MKRNFRVIQINGIRGLFVAFFVGSCLIAGFIAFPAFLTMNIWNYFSISTSSFPSINFTEGLLLWGIIIFSIFMFNKKRFIVSFDAQQELTDDEVREMISNIKTHTITQEILRPKEFNTNKEEENKEKIETKIEHIEK